MKNTVIGIVAHVDAGKTTLSEAMLYHSGSVDRLGRVDKGSSHLDTHAQERERGITIFSSQAIIDLPSTHITLIDTPGHVDFTAECERSLGIQDYAILVVSAPDGVRARTRALWNMLRARNIPTFIFVNKTDISDRRSRELLAELKLTLSQGCISFTAEGSEEFLEEVAGRDTRLMDKYFNGEPLSEEDIGDAVRRCEIFPCVFGAALSGTGVGELLSVIDRYTLPRSYPVSHFGARVFKIARDEGGRRITFAKITGGTLRPKETITVRLPSGEEYVEKVEELRVFSADRSRPLREAAPGTVVGIFGPLKTQAGGGLGFEADDTAITTPVLDYRMILPEGESPYEVFGRLSRLAEEDPQLRLCYDSEREEIRVSLMGEIQKEVLTRLILDRFGLDVGFDDGQILYRETLKGEVIGRAHFEPLRHYAEVHFRIEPLPPGSGIVVSADCPPDTLSSSWQRLIVSYAEGRVHRGKLIGAPLTDIGITLIAGRAHLKHTDSGDFRRATGRAIRQGVMKGDAQLLEPSFEFYIELPRENLGRAMTDLAAMSAEYEPPAFTDTTASLKGVCPVSTMRSYPTVLRAYTAGAGVIHLSVGPYLPCHNAEEVIAAYGYDPESDEKNKSASVFCRGGAGYTVPWYEADALMHVRTEEDSQVPDGDGDGEVIPKRARARVYGGSAEEDRELMRIFEATYGKIKPRTVAERRENAAPSEEGKRRRVPPKRRDTHLIIDGYNVIYAWDELRRTADLELALARDILIRMTCDYAARHRVTATVVFDAYRVKGGDGSSEDFGAVQVVYTKEGETADTYVERLACELTRKYTVRVVTSDLEEQNVVFGGGALRVSTAEFRREMENTTREIREAIEKYKRHP